MIVPLVWDSEHFGVPIGRVDGHSVSRDDVARADREGLRCVYLLLDASSGHAIRDAEDMGFRVIDVRLTLTRPLEDVDAAEFMGPVRVARPDDLRRLEPIAAEAHEDSRFFSDERFDRCAARDLYVKWLRGSVVGDLAEFTLSAVDDDEAVGYITVQTGTEPAVLSIVLL